MALLRELASKDNEFIRNPDKHGTALQKLKDLQCVAPVLQYYDVTKPVTVHCDASQGELEAVILQNGRAVE